MEKLDPKKVFADAQASGHIYPMKSKWRGMNIFAGVLCCLLIIGIPLGIWFIVAARRAKVGISDEGFAWTFLGTTAHRWEELETLSVGNLHINVSGGGLIGALAGAAIGAAVAARTEGLKGPIHYKLKGKRMHRQLPAQQFQNSWVMGEEIERRSGIAFMPKPKEG